MTGIALLLNLDMAVMLGLAVMMTLVVTFERIESWVGTDTIAGLLIASGVLAVALISLLTFMRMEG